MHGILLQQLDYTRSLLTQGTYDVIIHKLRPNPGMPSTCRLENKISSCCRSGCFTAVPLALA